MASLLGKNINQSYNGLLKTTTNDTMHGGLNQITDGLGNNSALNLGKSGNLSKFDSALHVNGLLLGCCNLTTNGNLCVKGSSTIDSNTTIGGFTHVSGNLTATNFNFTGAGSFNGAITFNNTVTISGTTNMSDTFVDGDETITGGLTLTGGISAGGDIVAFHSSDSRLKDNLIPIESENFVNNLTGYEFDWNDKSKRSGKGKGIIAQDLYKVDKTLVKENSDGFLSVDYIGLIPVLLEEVKRLGKEIEKLKNNS
jgi:hypothetical protein